MRATLLTVCVVAGAALGQASRDVVVTGDSGARTDRALGAPVVLGGGGAEARAGLLWTYVDSVSITESVSLGDLGSESWVAHSLNDKRMSKFTTTGSGTPDFVYSLATQNPGTIGVSSAEDTSLCAMIAWATGGPVLVRAFDNANGDTPLWNYAFDGAYTNSGKRAVDVNADGSRVAALAYDSGAAASLLVLLDGADGSVLGTATISGFCPGVEMDDSGERILVTAGATARLFDAATMLEVYALSTSGAGGYHRISRDGTAIAAGGFTIGAAREIGGVWQVAYSGSGSSDWFGWGMSISGDGRTLFVLSHNYGDGYLTNGHQVIDLETGSVEASWSYTGSGGFQNSAVGAQANQDGTVFVAASSGDQGNTQPEVRMFDRDLNMIGSIDTPGSPFEVVMDRAGHYVLVGSKAVHANTFGNGGRTYAYELDRACFADCDGNGTVNTQDFLCYLGKWSAAYQSGNYDAGADCNGDGTIDTQDFLCFLGLWAAGC